MTHYLEYRLGPTDDGKEVLFLMQKVLGFTTKKVRSVKHEEWGILLNGKRVTVRARGKEGQLLKVMLEDSQEKQNKIASTKMNLHILYEDEDVLIINKPKGMVVHPSAGHYTHTVVNAVMFHCKEHLSGINGVMRPGIVHRIDMDTTGAIVICKNDMAHQSLADQLKEHSITRKYRALVHGNLKEDEGTVEGPIGRHATDRKRMAINYKNGKPAVTHYRVLQTLKGASFMEFELETGRTHQIRVHMASIGHPLLGDEVYGPARQPFSLEGQTLHAGVLGFIHPRTGEYVEFSAPLPAYFEELLEKLRKKAGK